MVEVEEEIVDGLGSIEWVKSEREREREREMKRKRGG